MDGLRFGRQFRALLIRLERRQTDLAGPSGLSRSLIASIDRGEVDGVTVGALVRAARALGADVDIRLRWRGEQLDRLIDEAHAAVVEATVVLLKRHGWIVEVEVSFAIWGERGSIDVVGFHPSFGALLIIEVKAAVPDSQATIHARSKDAAGQRGRRRPASGDPACQPPPGRGGDGNVEATGRPPGGDI
jgi:transcriptional regulator with XRE-family HTH domain